MGKKKESLIKAVLDTNVFISALLFKGYLSKLVDYWTGGEFSFLISRQILDEYICVLSYPKFQLSEQEIEILLQQYLFPHVQVVRVKKTNAKPPRDIQDLPFIDCALVSKADYLVSGDHDLLEYEFEVELGKVPTKIISPKEFLDILRNL